MTIRFNPRWLLVPILLLSLQFCRAQIVVPATLSFDLGDTNVPDSQLWDFSGSYSVDLLVERKGQAVPVEIGFTLIQSPGGKLTTTTNELVNCSVTFNDDGNSSFVCQATISGKVTGSGGAARAHFTVHFAGNGSLGNKPTTIKGSFGVDAQADYTTAGQLQGTKLSSFSATFPGLPTIRGKADFAADLPQGIDGSWNLTLHLVGLGKLSGTGVVSVPNESLGLNLSGKFQKGLLVAKASGANNVPNTVSGSGISATILLPQTFDTIQVNGKILGQKMAFNVTAAPAPEE
jgi:hypothetical protein